MRTKCIDKVSTLDMLGSNTQVIITTSNTSVVYN